MPTYSYVCESCDHKFDHLQTMLDDVLMTCPDCGEDALKRLIGSGAGLIFKGSGFYITDYARKSDNGTNSSGSSKSSGNSSSDNSKIESKNSESEGKSAANSKSD